MSTTESDVAVPAAKRKLNLPSFGVYGIICIAVLLFWIFVALFAPQVAPYSESEIISGTSFAPVGVDGLLGTDYLGRDLLSRLFFGARMTLGLALVATLLAFGLGVLTGFVAGIAGGWVDSTISRIVDAFISFPTIMLALLIVSIFGTSLPALICAIGFIEATRVFRISRSLAANTMTMDFVEVSRARGENLWWILWNEVLPNTFIPLSTDFGLRFTFSILLLSSLSFLGLGVQPPYADWGSMVKDNMSGIHLGSMSLLLPALSIFTVTLSINFLVDWNLSRSQRDISDELVK
jgi:peptide/nickel transport system permease protein